MVFHQSSSTSVRVKTAPLVQQVAKRERLEQFFGTSRAIGRHFQTKSEQPSAVSSAATSSGRKSKVDSRLGLRRVKCQLALVSRDCRLDCAVARRSSRTGMLYSTVLGCGGVRICGERAGIDPVEPGRSHRPSRESSSDGFERFRKLEVDYLASTLDSQPQGQGEGHLGPGVEALSQRRSGFAHGAAFAPGSA